MTIKDIIIELENVETEMKNNTLKNRNLRKHADLLKSQITEYLVSKNENGIKYGHRTITLQNRQSRPPKPKEQKLLDVTELLRSRGIEDADEFYAKLLDIQKNDPVESQRLSFKRSKKKE